MAAVSKLTGHQILAILDEYEAGTPREELCERYGVSERTFFRWRMKFGRTGPLFRQSLTALQEENLRLKGQLEAAKNALQSGAHLENARVRIRNSRVRIRV